MDDWFQTHTFIANSLSAFQYVISTEGDHDLREQYYRYVTSESCKLAHTSGFSGEERLTLLNQQAEEVRQEFGRFKLLSEMKRKEREEKDMDRLRSLHSKVHKGYGDQFPQGKLGRKGRRS